MARIETACEGLIYISETDAPIVPFFESGVVSASQLGRKEGLSETAVEPFIGFFQRLTEERDWYGEKEKTIAKRFFELQKLLEENLCDLRVVRIGRVQIDIYVMGTDAEGNTLGFQTKAVET